MRYYWQPLLHGNSGPSQVEKAWSSVVFLDSASPFWRVFCVCLSPYTLAGFMFSAWKHKPGFAYQCRHACHQSEWRERHGLRASLQIPGSTTQTPVLVLSAGKVFFFFTDSLSIRAEQFLIKISRKPRLRIFPSVLVVAPLNIFFCLKAYEKWWKWHQFSHMRSGDYPWRLQNCRKKTPTPPNSSL